jgi:hypothetical protein
MFLRRGGSRARDRRRCRFGRGTLRDRCRLGSDWGGCRRRRASLLRIDARHAARGRGRCASRRHTLRGRHRSGLDRRHNDLRTTRRRRELETARARRGEIAFEAVIGDGPALVARSRPDQRGDSRRVTSSWILLQTLPPSHGSTDIKHRKPLNDPARTRLGSCCVPTEASLCSVGTRQKGPWPPTNPTSFAARWTC